MFFANDDRPEHYVLMTQNLATTGLSTVLLPLACDASVFHLNLSQVCFLLSNNPLTLSVPPSESLAKIMAVTATFHFKASVRATVLAPAIWAVISMVIIMMMHTAGHGLHILSAISGILISFVCYAFVDDTDVVHASPASSGEDVLADMQTVVDRWEGGLHDTGGALVPSKSHRYLIDFVWTGQKWRYRTIEELPGDISVLDKDGKHTVLE
jgi:hypothetical protein